ncbi:MAG TPA: hypothetical protein VLW17_00415 [Thermoanaerobaculaceae bacterium]|nr:hypothetical protein [Thermoanaerobaculaceae bacterium]
MRCVCLLPYHATAAGKRARLGRAGTLADTPRPSQERLEAIAARFEAAGVAVRIGG